MASLSDNGPYLMDAHGCTCCWRRNYALHFIESLGSLFYAVSNLEKRLSRLSPCYYRQTRVPSDKARGPLVSWLSTGTQFYRKSVDGFSDPRSRFNSADLISFRGATILNTRSSVSIITSYKLPSQQLIQQEWFWVSVLGDQRFHVTQSDQSLMAFFFLCACITSMQH